MKPGPSERYKLGRRTKKVGSTRLTIESAPLRICNDFNHVADTFYIENAVFTHLGASVHALASSMLRLGTKALDGNDFLIYNKATGVLSYDHDANGTDALGDPLISPEAAIVTTCSGSVRTIWIPTRSKVALI